MTALPTLRGKIFRSFTFLIALYAALGLFLVICVLLASANSPKMIHVNYDSISAANQMKEAWRALGSRDFRDLPADQWRARFEKSLRFEEGNTTEPGETALARDVRARWTAFGGKAEIPAAEFRAMENTLNNIVALNEQGMFQIAHANTSMSRKVLGFSILYLLVTLVISFIAADNLATRLSQPLKSIAEALHRRPKLGSRLKLVEPNSLELLILTVELKRLWDRVSETEKVNVAELLRQKSQLETVLESVEDALLVIDPQGQVTHCNHFMLELLNLPEKSVIGQKWSDLPSNNENYLALRGILEDEMADSHEIDLQWGPNRFQFAARLRKIGPDADRPIATLFLLHDITERRQRERFRTEFIDILSHEIKTPLQSLGTATELLVSRQGEMPEGLRPLAETIHEDVERMKAVASEFVQVTQNHSKVMKLRLQPLPLLQLIPEWIRPFRVVGKDKNVKIDFHPATGGPAMARVDPVKFPWVISNLLSNAIRFSPAGGAIEVRLGVDGGNLEIRVLDEGPGIPEEERSQMFDPFYQGRQAVENGKQGLFGIGLTIAKEVVEAHGGTITYHPRSPRGSEFVILLPVME